MAASNAYAKHPQHRIVIDDEPVALRVSVGGEILAETRRGLNLREATYPAVVYVPREDVRMERLVRAQDSTHCPFKGDASYFKPRASGARRVESVEPVAWSYETPFDQMQAIRGHIAFYADRVEIERTDV